jgi:hypothetical protein
MPPFFIFNGLTGTFLELRHSPLGTCDRPYFECFITPRSQSSRASVVLALFYLLAFSLPSLNVFFLQLLFFALPR